jgi:hypothetical protein
VIVVDECAARQPDMGARSNTIERAWRARMNPLPSPLAADRLLAPEPAQRGVARELYEGIAELPIISPHGHVDPRLLADEDAMLGTPAELFVIPDHYVFRMLYSQGIALESLGIRPRNATADVGATGPAAEADHRRIWQTFADNLHLFRGTPSGTWLAHELHVVFGVREPLSSANAQAVYDELNDKLARPEYRPRAIFERSRIETLCTTDDAADPLTHHAAIRASAWTGDVRPTSVRTASSTSWRPTGGRGSTPCRRSWGARSGRSAGLLRCWRSGGSSSGRWAPPRPTTVSRPRSRRRWRPPGRTRSSREPCAARPPRTTPGHSPGTC